MCVCVCVCVYISTVVIFMSEVNMFNFMECTLGG